MTLNAAFVEIFGDELSKLGYMKMKGHHPYFVRVINKEIIHFITYMKAKTYTTVQNGIVLYAFDIVGGVETVYRPLIELGKVPNSQDVGPFGNMTNNFDVCMNSIVNSSLEEKSKVSNFRYNLEYEDLTLNSFKDALSVSKKYLIPTLEKVNDINMCISFYHTYFSPIICLYSEPDYIFSDKNSSNESLLYFLVKDYTEIINYNFRKSLEEEKERIDLNFPGCKKREMFDKYCEETINYSKTIINQLNAIKEDLELYYRVMNEMNIRKNNNVERLINYGLI